jgi:hypothetical protein
MSLVYTPINGNAGTIIARLYDVPGQQVTEPITLQIVGFSESDVESEFNEEFTNIAGRLNKDHYGYHKQIKFSLINAASGDGSPLGANNLKNILKLISWINLCNIWGDFYRLEIQYRTFQLFSTMFDAIYVGDFSLNEISEKSNSGQSIPLIFKERNYHQLEFDALGSITIFEAEDSTNESRILLEAESSTALNKILLIP